MARYVALLRGINLGKRRIKMDALRSLFVELGFDDVATFIASGNVLFDTKARTEAKLAAQIEKHLQKSLGYDVPTYIRTRAEIAGVVAHDPFSAAEMSADSNTIHVAFLREPLPAATARGLAGIRTDTDAFSVDRREFYWLCRIPTHESKVWSLPAMKALKLPPATMRNITMLRRLAEQFPAK